MLPQRADWGVAVLPAHLAVFVAVPFKGSLN
jgi:hypothetical protein